MLHVMSEDYFADQCDQGVAIPDVTLILRNDDTYSEYIDQVAEINGFSRFRITYNHLTFDGACSMLSVADLLLNPWFAVAFPQPRVPVYKKTIQTVLAELKDTGADEPLDPDEQKVADLLPNGWTSEMGVTYYAIPRTDREFYRPSIALPLPGYTIKKGFNILHPCKKRLLNANELNSILDCNFINWINTWTAKLQIAETSTRYLCDVAFVTSPLANPVFVKPAFEWKL